MRHEQTGESPSYRGELGGSRKRVDHTNPCSVSAVVIHRLMVEGNNNPVSGAV